MSTLENCKSPEFYIKLAEPETVVTSTVTQSPCLSVFQCVVETLHWIVSLGLILLMDVLFKKALEAASIELFGCLATLCVNGYTAILARKSMKTELVDDEPMEKPSPISAEPMKKPSPFLAEPMEKPSQFSSAELWAWTGVLLMSFVASLFYPTALPTALGTRGRTCLPFLLASIVIGYMVDPGLPSKVKKVFHLIILCAASANLNLTAYAFGYFSKSGLDPVLGYYLTKSSSNPGAGDILIGFLGSVLLLFPFFMFRQSRLVERHAAEILTSVIISPIFLLNSALLVGFLIIFEPSLTACILPGCIMVALALSIVSLFEGADATLAAAVFGANYMQSILRDPIAQGIAPASSAHGLGTAALSAKEPEAFPCFAIAYALNGIFG